MENICKIRGCIQKHYAKGYCLSHWRKFSFNWNQYHRIYRLKKYGIGNRYHKCKIEDCKLKTNSKNQYCYEHKYRILNNLPMDLSRDMRSIVCSEKIKGKNNPRWNNKASEYPNHSLMKKNRLIILLHNPTCEICNKKPAVEVHHKNGDKSNHKLSNLAASCHKCNSKIRFKPNNSKFRRKLGMSMQEIMKKYKISSQTFYNRLNSGELDKSCLFLSKQ